MITITSRPWNTTPCPAWVSFEGKEIETTAWESSHPSATWGSLIDDHILSRLYYHVVGFVMMLPIRSGRRLQSRHRSMHFLFVSFRRLRHVLRPFAPRRCSLLAGRRLGPILAGMLLLPGPELFQLSLDRVFGVVPLPLNPTFLGGRDNPRLVELRDENRQPALLALEGWTGYAYNRGPCIGAQEPGLGP